MHVLVDDIFKYIYSDEKVCFFIKISMKFVPKCPTDNKSALIQVRSWCQAGDKPLPETILTIIYDAIWHH